VLLDAVPRHPGSNLLRQLIIIYQPKLLLLLLVLVAVLLVVQAVLCVRVRLGLTWQQYKPRLCDRGGSRQCCYCCC
jgi:hypothetical protein